MLGFFIIQLIIMKLLFLLVIFFPILVWGQAEFRVSGTVSDEQGNNLPGCHVHFGEVCAVTDNQGFFELTKFRKGTYTFSFTFMGFQKLDTSIQLNQNILLKIVLKPDSRQLGEIAVQASGFDTTGSKSNEIIHSRFILENLTGTFVKSLERLPGVNSMDVGANISKPVIRGMGFNRVVVAENGIKQESQQWGADHGLEMDPFSVESAEVVKGASAIEFGSDAMGGVIQVVNNKVPANKKLSGDLSLLAKSVNQAAGGSLLFQQRNNRFFYKLRTSFLDFGDYHLPADTIVYLTQKIPIYNQQLKNSAGNEYDLNGQFGFIYPGFKTVVSVSNVNQKSGFFPGAHGIPDLLKVADDGNRRNVESPFQQVNHFKITNNTKSYLPYGTFFFDIGYQKNHRQEWSQFHSHYPGQQPPEVYPDLELDFQLQTYTLNSKVEITNVSHHLISGGIQNQWIDNRVGGYNFFLPEYQRLVSGIFAKDEWKLNEKSKLFLGIRFDVGWYHGSPFFDSLLYQYVLMLPNRDAAQADYYAQRSHPVDRRFPGFSWHIGFTRQFWKNGMLRMNLGKAFRVPTAVELGANGVHHGSYRFEVGDASLENEEGYYADLNLEYHHETWYASLSSYGYYFTNYLYLQPTGELNHPIPDAGGMYYYRQSRAWLSGVEASVSKTFFKHWTCEANLELPYNYLLNNKGILTYGIPFSPSVNGFWEVKYKPCAFISMSVNGKWALEKDRSRGQGEMVTPGYAVFGASAMVDAKLWNQPFQCILQVQNLFGTKYYNSMSYYRKLDIPELGRNIQVTIKIPFSF
ncbi:MAG TPA: TonB-dependent receptor [Marinilabiliales bacterium]|nr:TonB-dependent receptor [Marinilabiliales bacterium]